MTSSPAQRERKLAAYRKQTNGRREAARDHVRGVLKETPCIRCGETDYRVLQFHHRKSADKVMAVGKMVNLAMNLDAIKEEMTKCDVMCSNCHIRHHWEEREINESLKALRAYRDEGTGRRGRKRGRIQGVAHR